MHIASAGFHLLVVEPPPSRSAALVEALMRRGNRVCRCNRLDAALRRLQAPRVDPADLLLLCPPDARAGLDALAKLRRVSRLPVMWLARVGEPAGERVTALEAGADDVLGADMPLAEVMARLKSVLRRAAWADTDRILGTIPATTSADQASLPPIEGGWRLVPHRRRLLPIEGGDELALTAAEYGLLRLLAAGRGEPVDRDAISRAVFRRPWRAEDRAIDGLVNRVKRKLGADAIAAVRGVGYYIRFAEPVQHQPHATVSRDA